MKLGAICTAYNEVKFIECSLLSIIDHVDCISLVEGSYKERIALGQSPRSTDGTLEVISNFISNQDINKKIVYKQANEESDAHQRNVSLDVLKQKNCDWVIIVDMDEVYTPQIFKLIHKVIDTNKKQDVFYHTCKTFVNDFDKYVKQQFPRLFRLYEDTEFVNDNFVNCNGKEWPELSKTIIDTQYFHYGFMKGEECFRAKKQWWENRFGDREFHYDWHIGDNGKITPEGHKVYKFDSSKHPEVIKKKLKL
jgi:glycosyltransferase involved in cell wall biosynthesis